MLDARKRQRFCAMREHCLRALCSTGLAEAPQSHAGLQQARAHISGRLMRRRLMTKSLDACNAKKESPQDHEAIAWIGPFHDGIYILHRMTA